MQPLSKRRSSLAPAGTKAGSPVGAGNPGSSAQAVPANARVRAKAATVHVKRDQLLIAPPVMTDVGHTPSSGSTGALCLRHAPRCGLRKTRRPADCSSLLHSIHAPCVAPRHNDFQGRQVAPEVMRVSLPKPVPLDVATSTENLRKSTMAQSSTLFILTVSPLTIPLVYCHIKSF